ncbi:MAG TPA: pantoate--beta-alanine ligase [Phycisphaerales bacterium]|nr:pantoate--beta-alanine ligase [Phycisphaerales bacterium]
MKVVTDAQGLAPLHGCVLVPTMGALHAGHFALVREAARLAKARTPTVPVVATIFVNPTQFNDPKDLERYPRTMEADVQGCRTAGADAVFAPATGVVYPHGQTVVAPPLPDVATTPGLEDAHRPGHFAGVCQVVMRLFALTRPSAAVFGEKDWQQLRVIAEMTRQEGLAVEIAAAPTVREPDGLAMSSRNMFLRGDERARARALSEALAAARSCGNVEDAERSMGDLLESRGVRTEYAVVRDAQSLGPLVGGRPGRALIAARVGAVRLIDNAPWPAP